MNLPLKNLTSKLQQIKLVITDVDGVLTDGSLFYSTDGMIMKKFFVKDGMAVHLLREHGIKCGIISSDKTDIILRRSERLKLDFAFQDVLNKKEKLFEVCQTMNINKESVAFIGDDVNDIEIIKNVGFSAAPSDAVPEIQKIVDYVCQKPGGMGAFRELADLIISVQKQ